jgi:hypothetical protein
VNAYNVSWPVAGDVLAAAAAFQTFAASVQGTTANLAATDSVYLTLESGRNNDNGTVAGDLKSGKSFKTRNTTINGTRTDAGANFNGGLN